MQTQNTADVRRYCQVDASRLLAVVNSFEIVVGRPAFRDVHAMVADTG
jgi:hypothetical protein